MLQKKKRRITPQVCLTIPQPLQDGINERIVDALDSYAFQGKPSLSRVVTALLEIALEKADLFDPNGITDSAALKAELARILCETK